MRFFFRTSITCLAIAAVSALPGTVVAAEAPVEEGTAGVNVIGGSSVSASTYTARHASTVALLDARLDDARDAHFCGGTLVGPTTVVTAAHCVVEFDKEVPQAILVKPSRIDALGGRRVLSGSDGQRVDVTRIVVHKEFNIFTLNNDFAILTLSAQPAGSTPVRLVGAGEQAMWGNGAGLAVGSDGPWVAGWGFFNQYDIPPIPFPIALADTLQAAAIPIVSDSECESGGPGNGGAGWGRFFDKTSMMCGGQLDTRDRNDRNAPSNGRDACYGDSGGPLLVSDGSSGYRLAGVVSWGFACADYRFHGNYTRVDTMRSFAESNPPEPVAKVTNPVVSGPKAVAGKLSCNKGQWTGGGTINYSYRWFRSEFTGPLDENKPSADDEFKFKRGEMRAKPTVRALIPTYEAFAAIDGATAATYTATKDDLDRLVFCEVTAENASWRQRAISPPYGVIAARLAKAPSARVLGRQCDATFCYIKVRTSHPEGAEVVKVTGRYVRRVNGRVRSSGTANATKLAPRTWQLKIRKAPGSWSVTIRAKDQYQNRSRAVVRTFNL